MKNIYITILLVVWHRQIRSELVSKLPQFFWGAEKEKRHKIFFVYIYSNFRGSNKILITKYEILKWQSEAKIEQFI